MKLRYRGRYEKFSAAYDSEKFKFKMKSVEFHLVINTFFLIIGDVLHTHLEIMVTNIIRKLQGLVNRCLPYAIGEHWPDRI